LRMAWRSHYVGHLRAVNNNLLDTYQLKSQNALLDGTVERIERRHISTFDLLDEEELARGTLLAVDQLPATIEYAIEWLIAVADR